MDSKKEPGEIQSGEVKEDFNDKNGQRSVLLLFQDGSGDSISITECDIILALQQIHTAIAHGGPQLLFNTVKREFTCSKLYSMCDFVCKSCPLCAYSKPISSNSSGFMERSKYANDIIYIDTVDVGIKSRTSNINLFQARRDAYTGEYRGSLLKSHTSTEAWNVFYRDHIKVFGRPNVCFCDQGTEFKGEFQRNCEDEGIIQRFSAVGRGQSNALVERPHREFWIALTCELAERNLELEDWNLGRSF